MKKKQTTIKSSFKIALLESGDLKIPKRWRQDNFSVSRDNHSRVEASINCGFANGKCYLPEKHHQDACLTLNSMPGEAQS